jgi:hypothetical protein
LVGRDRRSTEGRSLNRTADGSRGQIGSMLLIVGSLILWTPLLGCSHSASTAYPTAGQASPAPPPGYPPAATALPPSPPPNEYEQARTSAYPSVALADALRRSPSSPSGPSSTAAAPPPGSAPASTGPSGSTYQPPAASSPPSGAASAPVATPPNERDEALTAAYPSVSLSDIITGRAH